MMQIFNQYKENNNLFLLKENVTQKSCNENNETMLCTDTKSYKASCIQCNLPKCQYLNEDSLIIQELDDFSFDKDVYNCPVDAITIKDGYPVIDNKKCVLCGLCILNCPTGAIHFNKKTNKLEINKKSSDIIYEVDATEKNIKTQEKQIESLTELTSQNHLIDLSDDVLKTIQSKLQKVKAEYHNKIVRNILIGLGCKALFPRTGDVANRMDGVFKSANGYIGVLEVEFGTDSLSAARGLLDDIAMLKYKQKISKENITPLAVLVSMPNNRQDYWNVICDIKKVTGIEIHTMTICSLMILLWNRIPIDLVNHPYYADVTKPSIRHALEKNINQKINIPNGYLGILEPEK